MAVFLGGAVSMMTLGSEIFGVVPSLEYKGGEAVTAVTVMTGHRADLIDSLRRTSGHAGACNAQPPGRNERMASWGLRAPGNPAKNEGMGVTNLAHGHHHPFSRLSFCSCRSNHSAPNWPPTAAHVPMLEVE